MQLAQTGVVRMTSARFVRIKSVSFALYRGQKSIIQKTDGRWLEEGTLDFL